MIKKYAVMLVLVLLGACTHQVNLAPETRVVSGSAATRIDKTIGLYLSDAFRTAVTSQPAYGDTWKFPIGRASVAPIDAAVREVFARVITVDQAPPFTGKQPGFDAVLEPAVGGHMVTIPFLKTSTHRAEVTYNFTLLDPQGQTLAAWSVRGDGQSAGGFTFSYTKWHAEATSGAIEDAMRAFVETTHQEPEIRRWLHATQSTPTS